MMNQNALIMPTDYQVELGSRPLSDSEYSECSESSIESHLSRASNWTKGKSRQRLKVPVSLKNNDQIAKTVKERKSIAKSLYSHCINESSHDDVPNAN
jgi:hypothetical protein